LLPFRLRRISRTQRLPSVKKLAFRLSSVGTSRHHAGAHRLRRWLTATNKTKEQGRDLTGGNREIPTATFPPLLPLLPPVKMSAVFFLASEQLARIPAFSTCSYYYQFRSSDCVSDTSTTFVFS
jgi:hypothetical protein